MLSRSIIGLCLLGCCLFACCKSCILALLNDPLRQEAAARSPLRCRELALPRPCLKQKPLSRSWNTLFLTFQIFLSCPSFPQGFAAGWFLVWIPSRGLKEPRQGGTGKGQSPGKEPGLGAAFAWAEVSTLCPAGELQRWVGAEHRSRGGSSASPACTQPGHAPLESTSLGRALPPAALLGSAWRRDDVRSVVP